MTSRTSEVAVCCSQQFREVARACLHLLEQTDIADGDHGLIGEGLQQGNLFIAERVNFRSAKDDHPDALALSHQGHTQNGVVALTDALLSRDSREFVAFDRLHIAHMYRFLVQDCAP